MVLKHAHICVGAVSKMEERQLVVAIDDLFIGAQRYMNVKLWPNSPPLDPSATLKVRVFEQLQP